MVRACHSFILKIQESLPKDGLRPKSYVMLLPSQCPAEPNAFYCFSLEYNRLNLVQHGSGTMYELGLTLVKPGFFTALPRQALATQQIGRTKIILVKILSNLYQISEP